MQISEHLTLGKINRLTIERRADPGLYLAAGDGKSVLLPNRYVTEAMQIGQSLEVFVYTDSADRLVATTQKPRAMLEEFGFFKVLDTTRFGAFVDWGLPKDLFVPRKFQKTPFKVGERRILYIGYDEQTHRLIGEERMGKYLSRDTRPVQKGSVVDILVVAKTPLGYKVIVENRYEGLIFENEIFERIEVGERRQGYIKQARTDGKLDISLQPLGEGRSEAAGRRVEARLKERNGRLPYNFKSDPEVIRRVFGLSKKDFKRALTQLREASVITVDDTGIQLKKEG